ncbi:MAG: 50S ribosomal protein L21 [Candidatus Omnitrophica bacterium]|nr:50S ribosomal protein L21 [Candidatus Omnitrophota bacterium]
MFAVIQSGGKQYKVREGESLEIERFDLGKAKTLKLDRVLLLSGKDSVQIGRPFVKGAYCEAELVRETKGPKVISFKYIRREKSATKIGHRQKYLMVKIKAIKNGA